VSIIFFYSEILVNLEEALSSLGEYLPSVGVVILYSFESRVGEIHDWLEEHGDKLPAGPSDVDLGVKGLRGKMHSVREKVLLAGA
jgi:hypothetical protein